MNQYLQNLRVFRDPVHQSTCSDCLKCERLCLYRHLWHLAPKTAPLAAAAKLGTYVHRFFELGPGPATDTTIKAEMDQSRNAIIRAIEAGNDLTGDLARNAARLPELFHKARVITALYWQKYPASNLTQIVSRERTLTATLALGTQTINIEGTVDRIWREGASGPLWIRDFKSTGLDLELFATGYPYSIQPRFYRLLASLALGQVPIGFIFDGLQTPGIKFCKKDASFEAYLERVQTWYLDRGTAAIRSDAVFFGEDVQNPELINAILHTHDLLHNREVAPDAYARDISTATCKAYMRRCTYYPLCSSHPDRWPQLIESLYSVREDLRDDEPETETESSEGL